MSEASDSIAVCGLSSDSISNETPLTRAVPHARFVTLGSVRTHTCMIDISIPEGLSEDSLKKNIVGSALPQAEAGRPPRAPGLWSDVGRRGA